MLKHAYEPCTFSVPDSVQFRLAQHADMAAINRLHDVMWHQAHRGFAPHQIVGSPETARSLWPNDAHGVKMIAEQDGEIIGFGVGGPAQDAQLHADTEIHALYVSPSLRFRGIGSALLMSLARQLTKMLGAERAGLWISALHVGSVAFARALGAEVERRTAVQHAITSGSLLTGNPRLALVWHDINQLAYKPKCQPVRLVREL